MSTVRPVPRIPILMYHSVTRSPSDDIARFVVGPDAMARHLDLIVTGGHNVLTVTELVDHLDRGVPLAPGTMAITLDDGFEDNLSIAAPLLHDRGLPATVYVTTGFLSGTAPVAYHPPGPMLAWDELADLEAAGIEVGAHAHSHRCLDVLSHAEAADEIRLSKQLLETTLGHPVLTFAYPHGYASRWVEREVRRAGFSSSCGVVNAFSHPGVDRWHLARLTVTATTTVEVVHDWLRCTGAPVGGAREDLTTKAWRGVRRARALSTRALSARAPHHPGLQRAAAP